MLYCTPLLGDATENSKREEWHWCYHLRMINPLWGKITAMQASKEHVVEMSHIQKFAIEITMNSTNCKGPGYFNFSLMAN